MPEAVSPDVKWAVTEVKAKLDDRQRAVDYDTGNHPLSFATEKFRRTFGAMFLEMADNMCDDVVDEPADRIQVTGWEGSSAAVARLEDWWDVNQGAARSGSLVRRSFQQGDGFVIIWDDQDGDPQFYVQDSRQMAVRYSTTRPGKVDVAAKVWFVADGGRGGVYRLNLYYDDRIEHYMTRGYDATSGQKGIPEPGAFRPFDTVDLETGETVPSVEYHDHGQPVFHFPNGESGAYGRSALAQVYPLQDALNKSVADMIVAGEKYAIQNRWGIGIEVPKDPITGKELKTFDDRDSFWWTASKDAQFGTFPATELTGHLEQQAMWRREIARKGGLNPSTVDTGADGAVASGLALLVAEGKLVKRCKDRCRDWGMVLSDMAAYVLRWYGISAEAGDVRPTWAPVETRDEKGKAEEVGLKVTLGVPETQGLKELGYSEEQITLEFPKMREEEAAKALDRAAAAQNAMSGGRISPPSLPPAGPATPVPPNGAAEAVPAGAGAAQ